MDRLPIRIRLTLAFVVAISIVLTATGLFLYVRLGSSLDNAIDQGLRTRAADVTALVQQAGTGPGDATKLRGPDSGFVQVVGPSGTVVDATPGLTRSPLLTVAQVRQARLGPIFRVRKLDSQRVRLLAAPATAQGQRVVVVVGASLEPRAEALADLRRQLVVGGPIALLLASGAGYLLAAAALRPVERMGERAATISAANPGQRLPLPRADDEIARLGRRMNDMLTRLERALQRERTLVSDASHELRTPIALMKSEIELALAHPESAPTLAAALRSAGEETDRLSQLADDLLLLARVDSGTLPLRREPISVAELLATIATRFGRRAADSGRKIEVVQSSDLSLLGDRRRLEQALGNLIENALRHGAGTVRLEAVEGDGNVTLHVVDEGKGFPAGFLERAFERFSRGDGPRDATGAGLGLAIVAAVVHAHGGSVSASNPATGGAAVALTLPAPISVAGERAPSRATGPTGTPALTRD
jgi:signal transduction histidine kinase